MIIKSGFLVLEEKKKRKKKKKKKSDLINVERLYHEER